MKTYIIILTLILTTLQHVIADAGPERPLDQWKANDKRSSSIREDLEALKPVVVGFYETAPKFGEFIDTKRGTFFVVAIEISNFDDPDAFTPKWKIQYRVIGCEVPKKMLQKK